MHFKLSEPILLRSRNFTWNRIFRYNLGISPEDFAILFSSKVHPLRINKSPKRLSTKFWRIRRIIHVFPKPFLSICLVVIVSVQFEAKAPPDSPDSDSIPVTSKLPNRSRVEEEGDTVSAAFFRTFIPKIHRNIHHEIRVHPHRIFQCHRPTLPARILRQRLDACFRIKLVIGAAHLRKSLMIVQMVHSQRTIDCFIFNKQRRCGDKDDDDDINNHQVLPCHQPPQWQIPLSTPGSLRLGIINRIMNLLRDYSPIKKSVF